MMMIILTQLAEAVDKLQREKAKNVTKMVDI